MSPLQDGAVTFQCQRVAAAGGGHHHVGHHVADGINHVHRSESIILRAVTELTALIATPGPDRAVDIHHGDMGTAGQAAGRDPGGLRPGICAGPKPGHLHRSGMRVEIGAAGGEQAVTVATPGPDGAVILEHESGAPGGSDHDGVFRIGNIHRR